MPTLAEASLTPDERIVLDRFLEDLTRDLGDDLVAVWLYGSRVRSEGAPPDSDVDVLVLTRRGADDFDRVHALLWRNYDRWPEPTVMISPHISPVPCWRRPAPSRRSARPAGRLHNRPHPAAPAPSGRMTSTTDPTLPRRGGPVD